MKPVPNAVYESEIKVNELIYQKRKDEAVLYRQMIDMGKNGYCQYIADLLNYGWNGERYTYALYDQKKDEILKSYVSDKTVMLKKENKTSFIESLNIQKDGKLIHDLRTLNYIIGKELDLPYQIESFITSRTVNGRRKRYENAWRVVALVNL